MILTKTIGLITRSAKLYQTDKIVSMMDLAPGMSVFLSGIDTERLIQPISDIIGSKGQLTVSDPYNHIDCKREKSSNLSGLKNVSIQHAPISEVSLDNNAYDRFAIFTELGRVADRKAIMSTALRVLKSGGILIVTDFLLNPKFLNYQTVARFAVSAGFHETTLSGNPMVYLTKFRKPLQNEKGIRQSLYRSYSQNNFISQDNKSNQLSISDDVLPRYKKFWG